MSWGYFADLQLTLPATEWDALQKKTPADFVLEPSWSGLEEEALEKAFSRPVSASKTFLEILKSPAYVAAGETINRVTRAGNKVDVRVCLLLDKSTLELASPLAALFFGARQTSAAGTLRLVNDGTYSGENGSILELGAGRITQKKIDDSSDVSEELGEEILSTAPRGINPFTKQPMGGSLGINPFTKQPIAAPAKPKKTPKKK